MYRLFLFVFILFGSAFLLSAQKSKVIGTFQLIEKGKYDEAKGIIEDATKEKRTKNWARTWYARGVLCQDAYRKGMEKKDKDLYELYSDQLYIALFSFDRARYYDKHDRYDKILAPRYVILANDLTKLGEKYFGDEDFEEAFKSFEYALRIYKSTFLDLKLDTNLLYNTALSAYKSKKWDEALTYLSELNENKYSSNVPHLMFAIYIMQSDTASAHDVLLDGIEKYEDNEELILLLVDLVFKNNNPQKAEEILNEAFKEDTSNYIFPYTIGLLYQKEENYKKAIDAYKIALTVPSDTIKIYTAIGTCYYNMGAEQDEKARKISNNHRYLIEKRKSDAAYGEALKWFEKVYEMDADNQEIITKLNQLYRVLDKKEKLINLESQIQ